MVRTTEVMRILAALVVLSKASEGFVRSEALRLVLSTRRSRAVGDEGDDLESLLEEVAMLREEISAAEMEISDAKKRSAVEAESKRAPRGPVMSVARCMSVYAADVSGLPADCEPSQERAAFAEAMGFDQEAYAGEELSETALSFLGVAALAGESDELLTASVERFKALGIFRDMLEADDFSATDEIGALLGVDIRNAEQYGWRPGVSLAERSDACGVALWRRWRAVACDRAQLQRSGRLRERLDLLEKISDLDLIDAVVLSRRGLAEIVDIEPIGAELEHELLELVWRWKGGDSFETNCVLDVDKLLLKDKTAWTLLRFSRRADRARACALGLALDALLDDAENASSVARHRIKAAVGPSTLALLDKLVLPRGDREKRIDLLAIVKRLNFVASTSLVFAELASTLAIFALVATLLNLLPSDDSDLALAEQKFLDPIIFGSTDNRLDQLAAFDLKYGTNFLSLPHPPTEKYPDRGALPSLDDVTRSSISFWEDRAGPANLIRLRSEDIH